MALVELYRETGERRHLDLAALLSRAARTRTGSARTATTARRRSRTACRCATRPTVEGHAVRALYLTTGATDVYLETGDAALLTALTRQWEDMVEGKLYITGGVGARHLAESFGQPYELPSDLAYCETCGAIASLMWSWRMLLATGAGALRRSHRAHALQRDPRRRVARRRPVLLREPAGQQRRGGAPAPRRLRGASRGTWSPAVRPT